MVLQLSENRTGSSAAGERILDDCKGSEFKFFDLESPQKLEFMKGGINAATSTLHYYSLLSV